MRSVMIRTAAVAALLTAAACSGAPDPSAARPTRPADAGADRAAVVKAFGDYDNALLARDFPTACSLTAPQAVDAMVKSLATQGVQVTTCEKAFAALYDLPGARGSLDADARSAKIDDVVVNGDTATVTYSGDANGRHQSGLKNTMQRIGGSWRLVGNG